MATLVVIGLINVLPKEKYHISKIKNINSNNNGRKTTIKQQQQQDISSGTLSFLENTVKEHQAFPNFQMKPFMIDFHLSLSKQKLAKKLLQRNFQ